MAFHGFLSCVKYDASRTIKRLVFIVDSDLAYLLFKVDLVVEIDACDVHPRTLQVFFTVRMSQRDQYAGQVVVYKIVASLAEPVSLWHLVFQVAHVTLLVNGRIAQVTKDKVILRQLITNSKQTSITSAFVNRDVLLDSEKIIVIKCLTNGSISNLEQMLGSLVMFNLAFLK